MNCWGRILLDHCGWKGSDSALILAVEYQRSLAGRTYTRVYHQDTGCQFTTKGQHLGLGEAKAFVL